MKKAIKHIHKAIRALEKTLDKKKGKSVFEKYDELAFKGTLEDLLESINEKTNT